MRRQLLSQIASHPATATELAKELPITRQAVSKHLTCLSRAGLLARERAGRDVRYRVTPAPLSDAVSWMMRVGGEWDDRLARLTSSVRLHGRSRRRADLSARASGGRRGAIDARRACVASLDM